MLDLEPEEIYYNALRIDGMNNVFECLNEMSQKMEPHEMKELLVVPDLLAFLCDCWMQSRDNSVEEMREYLQKEIPQKRKLYQSLGVMGGIFLLILLWQ